MTTDNITKNNTLLISHFTLRKAIGWLGLLLPFILVIGNYFLNRIDLLNNTYFVKTICSSSYKADGFYKTSVSHYYYTTVGELFTGIMITVSLFMFCYKGHPLRKGEKGLSENALTNLAGFSALGVVLFPTSNTECINDNIRTFLSSTNTGNIHFIMATIFFLALSFMSIVNFSRDEKIEQFGKKPIHKVYLVCGIAMLLCIVFIAMYNVWVKGSFLWLDNLHPVFCFEAIALIFFGIAWLTKGHTDFAFIPKKLNWIK